MQHYLRRLTHLYLEDKGIDEEGDSKCSAPGPNLDAHSFCNNNTLSFFSEMTIAK